MREVPSLGIGQSAKNSGLPGIGDWGLALLSNRDLFGDLDAISVQTDDFAGMVGQQADGVETQIGENLRA